MTKNQTNATVLCNVLAVVCWFSIIACEIVAFSILVADAGGSRAEGFSFLFIGLGCSFLLIFPYALRILIDISISVEAKNQ